MTDAFKRFKNPDLEQIKNAPADVKEIGAGTSNLAREAFKLLQADKLKRAREESYTVNPDTALNMRMHELLQQKEEFFNQIHANSSVDNEARKKKLEMQQKNKKAWKEQINYSEIVQKMEKNQPQISPKNMWNIESPSRLEKDNKRRKDELHSIRQTLLEQIKEKDRQKQIERQEDMERAKQFVKKDIKEQISDAQVLAYKRHEMAKAMRDAWTRQQIFNQNIKQIENIF